MQDKRGTKILISVIVVNYKVPECLGEMIRSLCQADLIEQAEIVVVDNASGDDSHKLVAEFPEIKWIQLKNNIGFGKACNVGAQNARGEFILLINPDTVVAKNTLSVSVDFMQSHPEAGLMGPKILNPDGTLQPGCRRSFPTPLVAFYRFSGLSRIYPESKNFGKYNLTFLNPDQPSKVDAISGSFMFIRRSLFNSIGGFDEQFFMYGEDLDLCWRIREHGFQVWYNPKTQIIHRKGRSSAKNLLRSRIAFYEAMVIFSKKYRHFRGGFFPNWLIFLGIILQASINIGASILNHFTTAIIDLLTINSVLYIGMNLRFSNANPYNSDQILQIISIHFLMSLSFIFMFTYNGIYSKKKYSVSNALLSGMLASLVIFASVYFLKSVAFSRIVFGLTSIAISLLLVAWREIIPKIRKQFKQIIFAPYKILIIGNGPVSSQIIKNIEEQNGGKIVGILWSDGDSWPGEYDGYQVLGSVNDIKSVFRRHKIDTLLIATDYPWYSRIIETLSTEKVKNLTIRWAPHELFQKKSDELPSEIVLHDFSV